MTVVSRIFERLLDLPPAETRDIVVERDLPVPMPDGVTLLADHYRPRIGPKRPTILVRTPYGRAGFFGLLFGRPLAERGFQVLLQSCRGTYGAGGEFDPLRNEPADGAATLAWIQAQPWFSGELATFGASYMGFVQWAMAADAGPELKAMATHVTSSEFRSPMYMGGSFWLDTALTWTHIVHNPAESVLRAALAMMKTEKLVRAGAAHLPLREADTEVIGKPAKFLREWLEHDQPGDPWWKAVDFSERVREVTAPVYMLGGWYDVFLPQTLADYQRLRGAGRSPHLTIGPWTHNDRSWLSVAMRESIAWFRAHLLGDRSGLRDLPVRLFVMGANEWRDFAEWPPSGYAEERWYLQSAGGLSTRAPIASEPDRYRYDPADPTPSVGGVSLSQNAGPKDNRALETRADVLVYTSARLDRAVEVIGPVKVVLHVASSLEHTDFFARLCDVAPSGRSTNLTDGILRLSPGSPPAEADGTRRIEIDLWPTAHRFEPGHRIRVQVSSGAHPRFSRNTGSGQPLATATRLVAADQSVYHDPTHPSAILLPVER
ncbi:CocE/NonD family hydrolase [Sorangium sp. So ce406]|uniref:CocE/NonD family hydrolase n=1 Tax=Sorangium sp. So ce406 TaxID=3133311 RepID=UPI003F5C561F